MNIRHKIKFYWTFYKSTLRQSLFITCLCGVIERHCTYIRLKSSTKGILITDHNWRILLELANNYLLLHEGYLRVIKEEEDLKGKYIL